MITKPGEQMTVSSQWFEQLVEFAYQKGFADYLRAKETEKEAEYLSEQAYLPGMVEQPTAASPTLRPIGRGRPLKEVEDGND